MFSLSMAPRRLAQCATVAMLTALVLGAAACGAATTQPSAPQLVDPVGVYDLTTINGDAVPLVISAADSSYTEIEGGELNIDSNGQYHDQLQSAIVHGHNLSLRTTVSIGGWSVIRSAITLVGHSENDAYASLATGSTITAVVGDLTMVYRRRQP